MGKERVFLSNIKKDYEYFKVIDLIIEEKNNVKRKKAVCKCNCGNLFTTRTESLKKVKGCPKCGHNYGGKNRILANNEAAKRKYFSSYVHNAKTRNLDFSISRTLFDKLINEDCYYCGAEPADQSYLAKSNMKYNSFYASGIDRIDNNKGYTIDNVVSCCTKCNMMKKNMNYDDFIEHIMDIVEHMTNLKYKTKPIEQFIEDYRTEIIQNK